jgi:DNA invertase Pin-like site-specific DNA recombinase
MRVVAMFRVSTEKQANEGASLDAQQRTYHELAARNGWTTVAEFKGCESATQASSDRRVLQDVLRCIREQQPDAVYVHEQSRLTRGDELEVASLMRELEERNVKVIVGGIVRDLTSIDDGFMFNIQSLVDRTESKRIKERMRRGKKQRAIEGRKNSGPCAYGYINPPARTPGHGTLVIVPEQAAVVRRIFELAAAGKGVMAIGTDLNQRGYQAPRGGRWGKSTIQRVLDNPVYIGTQASSVWVADKGSRNFRRRLNNENAILKPGAHPAIIDNDLWAAAHGRPRVPRTSAPRLLTGLMWISGDKASGDSDGRCRFYRGPRGKRGTAWLHVDQADDAVWNAFVSLATGEAFVAKLMAEASSPRDRMILEQEVDFATDRIRKLENRKDRLVEMRADGEIDKDTCRRKMDGNDRQLAAVQAEMSGYRAKLAALDTAQAPRVVKAVQTLLAGRTRLTTEQKRAILNTIVKRVDVEAVPTGATFKRDERGRVLQGRTERWGIRRVEFRLTLPQGAGQDEIPREPACKPTLAHDASTPNGRDSGEDARVPQSSEPAEFRTGQLDTTPSNRGRLAGTESGEESRTGQLGTAC